MAKHTKITAILSLLALCGPSFAFSGAGAGTEAEPYVITNVELLQEMNYVLGAHYVLGNDIDASDTRNWNAGAGFKPVGFGGSFFTGLFDGKGHVITGLYIDRGSDYGVGLFGQVGPSGKIQNVGIVENYINGRMAVGALAGHSEGVITNCYATGTAAAQADVGGLVGYTNKIITRCYSSGSVIAGGRSGGFTAIGGLIGLTRGPDSVISNCYSEAEVRSTSAQYQTGGFIGTNKDTVYNCYSTGSVSAASGSRSRGFCSLNQGSISSCYWDTRTSGKTSSSGGTGKNTAQMMQQATFVNWDFTEVWDIVENETCPFLRDVPALQQDGLVARWAFDEGRGDIAYDSVGTNHGKIHGAQWTTGIIDGALSFQGDGDYVEIPDADSLTPRSAFTISYWLYIRDWEGSGIYKIALCPNESASPGNSRSYWLAVNAIDKNVYFRLCSAARTYDELVSLGRVTPNQWQHISATFNRGQAAVYINGQFDNAAQLKVKSIMNDAQPLIIGGLWSYCGDDHFIDTMGGAINNLMIFNRALSPEEIGRLYRNGLGFDPTSVGAESTGYYIPPYRRY